MNKSQIILNESAMKKLMKYDLVVFSQGRFDTVIGSVINISGSSVDIFTEKYGIVRKDIRELRLTSPTKFKVGDKVLEVEWSGQFPKGAKLTVLDVTTDGNVGVGMKNTDNPLYSPAEELFKVS
jgi:hypothetical protein